MTNAGILAKQVYIRLTDDPKGFVYTVKYGAFSLRPRLVATTASTEDRVPEPDPVPVSRHHTAKRSPATNTASDSRKPHE